MAGLRQSGIGRARRTAVLLLAATALAACTYGTNQANGCARSSLLVSTSKAAPGDSLKVEGASFLSECGDTVANGRASKSEGITDPISIYLVQGETRTSLGQAQADRETGAFVTTVRLPAQAEPGPATLETNVERSGTAEITIQ